MSVSCVGGTGASGDPFAVVAVGVNVTVYVPVGVGVATGWVTGTLCAIELPPPQPAMVITASPASAPALTACPIRTVHGVLCELRASKTSAQSTSGAVKRNSVSGVKRGVSETGTSAPPPAVATLTLKGTTTPLVTFIDAGPLQVAPVGALLQPIDTLPVKPGTSCKL